MEWLRVTGPENQQYSMSAKPQKHFTSSQQRVQAALFANKAPLSYLRAGQVGGRSAICSVLRVGTTGGNLHFADLSARITRDFLFALCALHVLQRRV